MVPSRPGPSYPHSSVPFFRLLLYLFLSFFTLSSQGFPFTIFCRFLFASLLFFSSLAPSFFCFFIFLKYPFSFSPSPSSFPYNLPHITPIHSPPLLSLTSTPPTHPTICTLLLLHPFLIFLSIFFSFKSTWVITNFFPALRKFYRN